MRQESAWRGQARRSSSSTASGCTRLVGRLGRPVPRGGLRADRARLAGDSDTVEETRAAPRARRRPRHRRRRRALRRGSSAGSSQADRHRPLLRRPHRAAAARRGPRRRSGGDRPCADQGRRCYLPLSALRVASIALRNPANRKRAVSLTAKQFRYGFGNALSAQESAELYERWTIPSPGRPLFEAAVANFSPQLAGQGRHATTRPRAAAAHGRRARTTPFPPAITKSTLKLYRKSPAVTDYKEFPAKGHSLALDTGWHEVADFVLGWLEQLLQL